MKKVLFVILFLLFVSSSFGVKPVTNEEWAMHMKSLGITEEKIIQLNRIENEYQKDLGDALNKSREYRKMNPGMGKSVYDKYTSKLTNKAYKNYVKEIGKILSPNQKKKYLEYSTMEY